MLPLHFHSHYVCWDFKDCGSFLHANPNCWKCQTQSFSRVGNVLWDVSNENKKKYVFYIECQGKSHFKNSSLTFSSVTKCDTIRPKRDKSDAFCEYFRRDLSFTEWLTWLMRACVSSCCYILSAVSVSECACAIISLFSGGWCVSPARCKSCQDVEGEQPASWRAGSKAKGPSVIFNTSATSLSSGAMVTSQKFLPPSETFPFYLPSLYSNVLML